MICGLNDGWLRCPVHAQRTVSWGWPIKGFDGYTDIGTMNKLGHLHPHFEICAHEGLLSLKLRAVCHLRQFTALLTGRMVSSTSRKDVQGHGNTAVLPQNSKRAVENDE